jgi:hypothetical protein
MSAPEERFALDEVCLLIAAHGQPRLDIAAALAELDRLAGDFLPPTLDGLLAHLFGPG